MLVLMELGYSVPALQVGLVGRTDHFLLYVRQMDRSKWEMIIGLPTMDMWESIGIWAIRLAQIGAHVGSPLRQNPKTRVYNIAI